MDHLASDKKLLTHLSKLKTDVLNTYDLKDVVKFLEDKTFLQGSRFSFKDHEVQADILSDTNKVVNVQKCAQVGMSEAMSRYGLGLAAMLPYFNVIQTMPSATDASNFVRTRIDPILTESPALRELLDRNIDNSELKSIGTSYMYFKGTIGNTTALSVPAELLIHDEVDRSDRATLGQYQSRLKHGKFQMTRRFGTPTAAKRGIAKYMETSMRRHYLTKCNHCNHWFLPNFHDHVRIPGFEGKKEDITRHMLQMLNYKKASVHCPKCDKVPSLQRQHRNWVVENVNENHIDIGYFVTPFAFPNIVTIPKLVEEITNYESWAEFQNQALGETSNSDNSSLTETDLMGSVLPQGSMRSSEVHCMGIDVGQTCHISVGRITQDGMLLIVHKERCSLANLPTRKIELMIQYSVVMTVIDAFPETYMVMQMQLVDQNLWGGVYHDNPQLATYELKKVEAEAAKGKLPVSQAKIHRDLNFDEIMFMFKAGRVRWASTTTEDDAVFVGHCLDMTRGQIFKKDGGMAYTWEKSKMAQDHFWHSVGYLHVACRLAPTASWSLPAEGFSLAFRCKMGGQVPVRRG